MTHDQIVNRIIEQEIFVNASTFVSEAAQDETNMDNLLPACMADDYETPVRDAIATIDPAELYHLCDTLGYELRTKNGTLVESEEQAERLGSDSVDRTAVTEDIESDNDWQGAAEHLDLDPETIEALQHWLVSEWLAYKLEAIGAMVARDVMGFDVWGRSECGQCLTMDSDINKVAAALVGDQ